MAFFWLTGLSGSGKSAVIERLSEHGYLALDADEDGMSVWINRDTGVEVGGISAADRHEGWIEQNQWCIKVERATRLAEQSNSQHIFLGGSAANENEIWSLFDRHVFLALDNDTIRRRVLERTNNDFGKAPGEMETILGWNETAAAEYRRFGATIIDASQPLPRVINDVLAATVETIALR